MSGIIEICHETASINNRQKLNTLQGAHGENSDIFDKKNSTTAQISGSREAKQYERKENVSQKYNWKNMLPSFHSLFVVSEKFEISRIAIVFCRKLKSVNILQRKIIIKSLYSP